MTTALDRAKALVRTEVFPGDVVAAIIVASKLPKLPANDLFLSTVFYRFSLSKPHLFEDFDFFAGGTFPFTEVLHEQLAHFETEHFLGKPNPSYRVHEVRMEDSEQWSEEYLLAKFRQRGWLDDVVELGEELHALVQRHFETKEHRGGQGA